MIIPHNITLSLCIKLGEEMDKDMIYFSDRQEPGDGTCINLLVDDFNNDHGVYTEVDIPKNKCIVSYSTNEETTDNERDTYTIETVSIVRFHVSVFDIDELRLIFLNCSIDEIFDRLLSEWRTRLVHLFVTPGWIDVFPPHCNNYTRILYAAEILGYLGEHTIRGKKCVDVFNIVYNCIDERFIKLAITYGTPGIVINQNIQKYGEEFCWCKGDDIGTEYPSEHVDQIMETVCRELSDPF